MRLLSLFSGIEAASVAWEPLGWECVAVSEIEPFPAAMLQHHYPSVPNLGDVTRITEDDIKALGPIDLVVFGSPCQDLSVAGRREGIKGEQSGLFLSAIKIIEWARKHNGCRFALWENVPGAFSTNKGRDFAAVVEQMAGLRDVDVPKYGWGTEGAALGDDAMLEWSVLDAQWFGVAQRRRRVFAIADCGDWARRPPILLERHSLRGDTPPSREQGQDASADARAGIKSTGSHGELVGALCARDFKGVGNQYVTEGKLVISEHTGHRKLTFESYKNDETASTVMARDHKGHTDLVVAYGMPGNWIGRKPENGGNSTQFMHEVSPAQAATDKHGVITCATKQQAMTTEENLASTLAANDYKEPQAVVTLTPEQPQCWRVYGTDGVSPAMQSGEGRGNAIFRASQVRRLTPIECERLQGFPDNWTQIPWRNKPAEDC